MSIRNHIPEFIDFDFVEASLRFFVYPDPALLCRSGYAKAQGGAQNRVPVYRDEPGATKINLLPPIEPAPPCWGVEFGVVEKVPLLPSTPKSPKGDLLKNRELKSPYRGGWG
jgi:hypothetical protein